MTEKRLTEAERQAMVEKWTRTPSPNPRYGGATPAELARRLLRREEESPTKER